MAKNLNDLNKEEILEEKRLTVTSMGIKYLINDDIKPYLDGLGDKLDDLSHGEDPLVVSIRDAEVKGQIYAIKQILSMFDKYKK